MSMYPIKSKYNVGDKIRINHIDGHSHYDGREGVVTSTDDMGQAHGTWGGVAINDEDDVTVIH